MDEQKQAVKGLRGKLKMNRREFCRFFDIPYRTVCDWEAGKRRMPDYVLRLITARVNEVAGGSGAEPREPDTPREVLLEAFPEREYSEKELNNLIFLFYLITEEYKKRHNLSTERFLDLNGKRDILGYIAGCPEIFDSMAAEDMVREVDEYVGRV